MFRSAGFSIGDPFEKRIGQVIKKGLEKTDVALLGVPWDGAAATRAGSRAAPKKIREHFYSLPYQGGFEICDYGDVDTLNGDPQETWKRTVEAVKLSVQSSLETLVMGGDSTSSYCAFKAFCELEKEPCYLLFDAHPDVRVEYPGLTSGRVVRWIREASASSKIIVVGVREHSNHPYLFTEAKKLKVEIITMSQIENQGLNTLLERLLKELSGQALQISVNMDAFDPSCAPGVNSPSVGGFYSRELLWLVEKLCQTLKPKLFDLVEFTPCYDVMDMSALLAATTLSKAIWVKRA